MNVISTYTRAQAIADGVLVDVSGSSLPREAGLKWPVAFTAAAYAEAVALGEAPEPCQSIEGRLWDVLWLLRCANTGRLGREATVSADGTTILFPVRVLKGKRVRVVKLKSIAGPGDNGEPVITIMLPNED